MKRIPLILSPALLLLLPAIALYPMLHASAEKDGVDSSTAIQEAAPSEAAPSEAAPSEVLVQGDDFFPEPLCAGQIILRSPLALFRAEYNSIRMAS